MGYYCTVPQCTSLAGKTKNVKFHRFPRDTAMADKWNNILKRGKPYTKYSKVCSLHFTQADYNVTTMGQWKTLSKDAIPSQNLPRLNPDGSVMVIRKSRTIKYKETRKEDNLEKMESKWSLPAHSAHGMPITEPCTSQEQLAYRLQTLGAIANSIQPQPIPTHNLPNKPKKQDAFMQTDPILNEDDDTQPNNSYSEVSEKSYNSEIEQYGYQKDDFSKDYPKDSYPKEDGYSKDYAKDTGYQKDNNYVKDSGYQKDTGYVKDSGYQKDAEFKDGSSKDKYTAKDYTKTADDYIPQTNEEYNKEAEKYFLDRTHNGFEKDTIYHKRVMNYPPDYYDKSYPVYSSYQDSADVLRNQQQNLHLLQDQSRLTDNQNFFNENHIKQEIDINIEEEKFPYDNRSKDQIDAAVYPERRRELGPQVKQEPETPAVCDVTMQPQSSPYYQPTAHNTVTGGYYDLFSRPGPELLIAKQNALAAHTELWQNMKRPFIYPDHVHYNPSQLLHNRYEV